MKKLIHILETSWGTFLLLLLVTLLTYGSALFHPFLFDDVSVLAENAWLNWAHIPTFFRSFVPTSQLTFPGYRPFLMTTFAVEKELWGLHPWVFRLTNGVLHAGMGFAVFALARRWIFREVGQATRWSLLAAFIFLLHPVQSNVITLIWKRSDLLAGLGMVGALASYAQFLISPHRLRWSWWLLGSGLATVALCSKESALILPLLWLGVLHFFDEPLRGKTERWVCHFSLWALVSLFAWIHWVEMPTVLAPWQVGGMDSVPPSLRFGPLSYLRQQTAAWLAYGHLLLWPHPLEVFHPLPPISSWRDLHLWGGLACAALTVGSIPFLTAHHRPLAGALVWFVLLLLPSSSLVPLAMPFDEDRLYLPMMGVAWAAAYSLHRVHLWARRQNRPYLARLAWALPLLVMLIYFPVTQLRLQEWRSGEALWTSNALAYPQEARAWVQLGVALAQEKQDVDHSRDAFLRAIALEPDFGAAHFYLGKSMFLLGQEDLAEHALNRALRLRAYPPRSLQLLGVLASLRQEPGLAFSRTVEALNLDPGNVVSLRNLSLLLDRHEQPDAALFVLMRAWLFEPQDGETLLRVADLLLRRGNREEALAFLNRAEKVVPQDPRFLKLKEQSLRPNAN